MSRHSVIKLRITPINAALFSLIAVVCVIACVYLMATYRTTIAHAFSLATSHQPERYSELYFTNSTHLPFSVPLGQTKAFDFRIVNHEASKTTYTYLVLLEVDGVSTQIERGTVTLEDGRSADVTVPYTPPRPNISAQITVQLIDRAEQIAFRSRT
jgi:hypothetical protein